MTSKLSKTDIHLVGDFGAALDLAQQLNARAVGLDMEGVLGNYVGNQPYANNFADFIRGQGKVNMQLAQTAIRNCPNVPFGIITNNTNQANAETGQEGLVTRVANHLGIVPIYKGMQVGGVALRAKPSGDQAIYFCQIVGVSPDKAVIIDDQGVKNAGEAVAAGLGAIIVPKPIGLPYGTKGRVAEHRWVRRARMLEPNIYASLKAKGWLARVAYRSLAKIDLDLIGNVYDHRAASEHG